MGIVARASEKSFGLQGLAGFWGFSDLLSLPLTISWFISAIGIVELCQGSEISMDFLAGALYAGSPLPLSEFEDPACQDYKIRQLCPELLNEPANSFSTASLS